MVDITSELDAIANSIYGSQMRSALYSALKKIAEEINGEEMENTQSRIIQSIGTKLKESDENG